MVQETIPSVYNTPRDWNEPLNDQRQALSLEAAAEPSQRRNNYAAKIGLTVLAACIAVALIVVLVRSRSDFHGAPAGDSVVSSSHYGNYGVTGNTVGYFSGLIYCTGTFTVNDHQQLVSIEYVYAPYRRISTNSTVDVLIGLYAMSYPTSTISAVALAARGNVVAAPNYFDDDSNTPYIATFDNFAYPNPRFHNGTGALLTTVNYTVCFTSKTNSNLVGINTGLYSYNVNVGSNFNIPEGQLMNGPFISGPIMYITTDYSY